jgi:3-dehydroquinate synthase
MTTLGAPMESLEPTSTADRRTEGTRSRAGNDDRGERGKLRKIEAAGGEIGTGHVLEQCFSVSYQFPIYFTQALFDPANPVFVEAVSRLEPAKRHRMAVFVDDGLLACWPGLPEQLKDYVDIHGANLELAGDPEPVPGGERVKNAPQLIEKLTQRLLELGIDRHSYVVAIGGGAVLDMAGYVAATAHRGVRHVRVPTTVLSQDDSGVGVKNGVNAFGVKNFVGTFAPPFAVINDFDFLATLEPRDKKAGMAEAVKVSLIRDADFYAWIERSAEHLERFEAGVVNKLVRRCAELHMGHIGSCGDPFEMGSARPLDFGHWAAHKLESLSNHALRHGEAVAIGIALDTRYSVQIGMLQPGGDERVCSLLEKLGFRLWHPALDLHDERGTHAVMAGLREFREHLGGELTVTLLADIGRGQDVHEIDEAEMLRAIHWLEQRDGVR